VRVSQQKKDLRLVGIFGGTFDPVHCGHLRVAQEIAAALHLDEMRFMPAGEPRLRDAPQASAAQRVAMLRLALRTLPKRNPATRWLIDERELHRGGALGGQTYSVDSLRELKKEMGTPVALCFIIGTDAFMKLPQWHDWRALFDLCHFVIAGRNGVEVRAGLLTELARACETRWVRDAQSLRQADSGLVYIAPNARYDVAATDIRLAILNGNAAQAGLPDEVLDYIHRHHLYGKPYGEK